MTTETRRGVAVWALAVLLVFVCVIAHAQQATQPAPQYVCSPLGAQADAWAEKKERAVTLTPDQWEFMRGAMAVDASTPVGLPPGDHAVLLKRANNDYYVGFVDGALLCGLKSLAPAFVTILMQVGTGEIVHSGNGL